VISKATKPYLVRAIWEWCADNGYTAYLVVQVDENTRVPPEYVKNGEIILNISADATHKLTLGNELIQFAARFAGVSRECSVPMPAVRGIFARENGEGMFFQGNAASGAASTQQPPQTQPQQPQVETPSASSTPPTQPSPATPSPTPPSGRRPHLQIVK
jgi:stringent starvation protein B